MSFTVHLLNTWSMAAVNLAASTDPSVPATTDDQFRDYGPGFAGFVATGAMVVIVILLIWDMTRRIRRIRYQSEQQQRQADLVAAGEEEAAQRQAVQTPRSAAETADDAGDGDRGTGAAPSGTDESDGRA